MFFFKWQIHNLGNSGMNDFPVKRFAIVGTPRRGGRSEPPIVRKNGVIGRGPEINGLYIPKNTWVCLGSFHPLNQWTYG